jgi:hypothetical protein
MDWLPVVHWHLRSVRLQPEPWIAVAKQGIYPLRQSSVAMLLIDVAKHTAQLGTLLKS